MHVVISDPSLSKSGTYREIGVQLKGLFADERNALANTANMCALLYQMLPDVNWVGFYFLQGGELVLGPFQGGLRTHPAGPWRVRDRRPA